MRVVSERELAVVLGSLPGTPRTEQITSQVAHPSVRDELRQAGRNLGLRV